MANLGAYGYPLPPNAPTRVAPAEWRSFRAILTNVQCAPQHAAGPISKPSHVYSP